MIVLEEIEQRADVRVTAHHFPFYPVVVNIILASKRVPGTWWRQDIVRGRYRRHNVDLYRNGAKLGMSLPAICQNARLDDLLNDEWRLTSELTRYVEEREVFGYLPPMTHLPSSL